MSIKVAKFGGTSLADAAQFRKVQAIVQADPQRRYIVPSAPGKRRAGDKKITDLLYLCHAHVEQELPFDEVFELIAGRYQEIVKDLGLKLDLRPHLDQIKKQIARGGTAPHGTTPDYAASRGEYLSGLILADLLGYDFVDAAEVVLFDEQGRFDAAGTQEKVSKRLAKHARAVIPGFYGASAKGQVRTFSRGGSDISGAIVARGVGAAVYENWTDVCGLLMADPRVVPNPRNIDVITYRELRELAYMGATVLHDEAIFPVRLAGIPVNIRNTNEPEHPGTRIVRDAEPVQHKAGISGIAGRKDFTVIALEKAMMNTEIGFGRRLLSCLEDHGVSYEHTPSGIDTMSVVVADAQIKSSLDAVLADIRARCQPDALEVHPHMALIATVGRGMARTPGVAAKLFGALAAAGINIRMIDQGSSEINIIVGVATKDFEPAVRAIYQAFVAG
jgi:aspartate kinase